MIKYLADFIAKQMKSMCYWNYQNASFLYLLTPWRPRVEDF